MPLYTYILGIWILSASFWRPKSCQGLLLLLACEPGDCDAALPLCGRVNGSSRDGFDWHSSV